MPDASGWRYERKFPIEGLELAEVEQMLRDHPLAFSTLFPSRWINSIYCETPDMESFHAHVSGSANRVKARIRWYGDLQDRVKAILELKIKKGLAGRKEFYPMAPFRMNHKFNVVQWREWVKKSNLPADIHAYLLSRERLLVNRYKRRYWGNADGRFRLTLDDQLEFWQPHQLEASMVHRRLENPLIILELKYAREADAQADQVTRNFPFRLGRVSKYITAVEDLSLL